MGTCLNNIMDNQQKTLLQQQVASKMVQNKYMAILWATSLGKSFAAIRSILSTKSKYVLIIVAERAHKKNWKNEFVKFKELFPEEVKDSKLQKLQIECYASLHKLPYSQWDMVIWDEAHHLYTQKRMDYAQTIQASNMMFLSATLSRKMLSQYSILFAHPILVEEYTLQKGFDSELLAEPKIFAIRLELDNTVQDIQVKEGWGSKNRENIVCTYEQRLKYMNNKKYYKAVNLTIKCSEKQYYDYLTEKMNQYETLFKNTSVAFYRNYWMKYASMRKKFVGEWKIWSAYNLIGLLIHKKYICFCASIDQAKKLNENLLRYNISSGIIHSKLSTKQNAETIEKFNKNEISHLFAINMLKEGQNLTGIQAGIIIQLDGEIRSFIQRFGRVLRAESPEQYILYVKDTQDEKYKNEALAGIDSKYIKELTLHELVNSVLKHE